MRVFVLILLFFIYGSSSAMDPPEIAWTAYYDAAPYSEFHNAIQTSEGGFIVSGWQIPEGGGNSNISLFRYSQSGNLVWTSGAGDYTGHASLWLEMIGQQNVIVTGTCGLLEANTSAVFISNVDIDGQVVWTKSFDFPDSDDQGNFVCPLLDGGFVITGYREFYPEPKQTFVIRLNSQGDSLWSYTCSESFMNEGQRVFEIEDGLLVFSRGVDYPGGSVRFLLFSEADGSLVWEHSLPAFLASTHLGGDMTLSGTDNGYTIVTSYWPQIVHVDSLGNLLWNYEIPAWWQPYGHSINSTMDGGYIYGGENIPDPDNPESFQLAEVVKFDSEGNVQWANVLTSVHSIKSIRQLQSGGYIGCGGEGTGTLILYEPETGIEGSTPAAVEITSLSSNPFSESLTVHFSLNEASETTLTIFDLSGRVVAVVHEGFLPAGEHSSVWTPVDESSGCYLIRLSTPEFSTVQNCVLVR